MIGAEIEARFWTKVDWDIHDTDRCWPWLASKMHKGYGQFSFVDVYGQQCVARAHRLAYELEVGSTDLQLDHLCHDPRRCTAGNQCPHRACCNPAHMRAVTNAENHAAGRVNGAAGGRAALARLTPEQRSQRVVQRWVTIKARAGMSS